MRLLIFLIFFYPLYSYAQVEGRQTIPPNNVREVDVSFSQRVWRIIDLREKQNIKAVWPKAPINKILYDAAATGKLFAYRNDSLRSVFTPKEFTAIGYDTSFVDVPIDPNDPTWTRRDTVLSSLDPLRIDRLMIMEDVYFDRKLGTMIPRIIAVAPLCRIKALGMNIGLQPLCWFKYYDIKKKEKDCRSLFVNLRMFNKENSYSAFTFDDWFEQRQFNSHIIKTSNMHDLTIMEDPEVKKSGIEALIKAEKLKRENQEYDANKYED